MDRIDKIDYAPFYLSRAILKSGVKKEKRSSFGRKNR